MSFIQSVANLCMSASWGFEEDPEAINMRAEGMSKAKRHYKGLEFPPALVLFNKLCYNYRLPRGGQVVTLGQCQSNKKYLNLNDNKPLEITI